MTRAQALAILRRFEARVRDDEIRGSMHPDDRDDTHNRYLTARDRMVDRLMKAS